jgi:ferritin-like metal-binding protein YciE
MATKKKYETLHDLLILKLQVLHDVENQLVKALPKMAKAAHSAKLKEAFSAHLEETKRQEERIDEALELAGDEAKGKEKSEAIRGLIKDAEWCIKNITEPAARDASLIAAAQYVEHYEMAGYGAARTWAEEMGHRDIAELLQATLDEEGAANEKLTKLAERGINEKANEMEEETSSGGRVWNTVSHSMNSR